ncbi:MAG: NAD(P)-binding domain-containing protein, partial [Burkholderiaceae bacterium]
MTRISKSAPDEVGIIGVGNMGLAMATRLLGLGWRVCVRDIDPLREALASSLGARVCAAPAEVAASAACVVVSVVDARQVEAVLFDARDGITSQASKPSVLMCPTIAPDDTEGFAQRLAGFGLPCVDAPMSGGPLRAREGRMSLMVACDDALFERHAELLNDVAQPV